MSSQVTLLERIQTYYAHRLGDSHDGLSPSYFFMCLRAFLLATVSDMVLVCREVKDHHHHIQELARWLYQNCGIGPGHENVKFYDEVCIPDDADVNIFSGTSAGVYTLTRRNRFGPSQKQWKQANSKAYFQSLAKGSLSSFIPRGTVIQGDDDLLSHLQACLKQFPAGIFIKSDQSGGSQDGWPIMTESIDEESRKAMKGKTLIVQEMLNIREYYSAQFEFDPVAKKYSLYAFTRQLMKNGSHFGNVFPVDLSQNHQMFLKEKCEEILGQYECFEIPYVSVDIVQTQDGNFFALEVNARLTAPYYGLRFTTKLFGKPGPFYMRSFPIKEGENITCFAQKLGDMLFDKEKKEGVLPFVFIPGVLGYVIITSSSQENVESLEKQFQAFLDQQ